MCRQLLYLILSVVVLGMVAIPGGTAFGFDANRDPSLVGWWTLDDGSGTVAVDSSPSGNDGTLTNGPVWVAGYLGGALQFDGTDDYVDTGWNEDLATWTVSAWVISPAAPSTGGSPSGPVHRESNYQINWNHSDAAYAGALAANIGGWKNASLGTLEADTWYHLCGTFDGTSMKAYTNGELITTTSASGTPAAESNTLKLGRHAAAAQYFGGMVDDARVYNRALTLEEIQVVMLAGVDSALASAPFPQDEAVDEVRDVVLSWTPGDFAPATNGHKLFFGDVFEDVNDGAAAVDRGVVSDPSFDVTMLPFALDFGTTYYWRIDEANSVTGWDVGPTWSFTTEPYAYPIEGITVSTNTTPSGDQVPENVVNGAGLNADDQHSSSMGMWAGMIPAGESAWLQLDLPRVYKLHDMMVWNYNHSFEMIIGAGAKDVTIEYSEDGTNWATLGDFVFARGTGASTYTANTVVPFDGVAAQHVRLTFNASYVSTSLVGLSELRLSYIPSFAREPKPADAATGVAVGTSLSWRAARDAVSNDVYLSTDPNALVMAGTSAGTTLDAGPFDLDTTYYWQVVSDDGTGTWAGDVWSFATQPYIEIDGFETYDDEIDAGTTIWQTWIDSLEDPSNGGSFVGNDPSPFAELTIVHSGNQSMPLFYENTTASAISETDYAISPAQDWTASNIQSLSLWFQGAAGNAGKLYVKINNTKVSYPGDPANIAATVWLPWTIDLSATGANLNSVSTLSIGIEGAGAGVVYVDDVRLYPKVAQIAEPVQPGTANLVAYYTFENNVNDTSGNGHNGTINGAPSYAAGKTGSALVFDGVSDYVHIDSVGINPNEPRTIAGWARSDTIPTTGWGNIFGFTGPATNGNHFDIEWVGDSGTNATLGWYGLHRHGWERNILPVDMEWHHLAATFDGVTVAWYGDGQQIGSEVVTTPAVLCPGAVNMGKRQDNEVFFDGAIDDVRIYNVGLTPGEIAGLAGKTAPVILPF